MSIYKLKIQDFSIKIKATTEKKTVFICNEVFIVIN